MATNKPTGDNSRIGAVKERSQVLNTKTELYVKRDSNTGRFMDVKTTGGKFKGVRTEKWKIVGQVLCRFALIKFDNLFTFHYGAI